MSCIDCGEPAIRTASAGPWPKRCPQCRPAGNARPPHMESTCADCGCLILREGRRGALRKRCVPCEKSRKAAARTIKERERKANDPEYHNSSRTKQRDRYRAMGPPERTEARRAQDRAAYHRMVSTPEGRERARQNARRVKLRKNYGLTVETYNEKLSSQDGLCAICRTATAGGKYGIWHIDHDHETGLVRGILCADCNLGLGRFRDDPVVLQAAIAYLATWGRSLPSS